MREITLALLQRGIAGDRSALRDVLAAITPVVQARAARALLRYGGGARRDVRQEVEDLTQQVFLALFADDARALRQWDPARGLSLPNFVGLLAEREVITIVRSRRKNPWTEEPTEHDELDRGPDSDRGPERIAASRETLAAVLGRLRERLNERGHDLFRWLVVEGRAVEEVCSMTGMTPDAVYAWRTRFARLVREIAEDLASDPAPGPRKTDEPLEGAS